jgi:hypothetical protein
LQAEQVKIAHATQGSDHAFQINPAVDSPTPLDVPTYEFHEFTLSW